MDRPGYEIVQPDEGEWTDEGPGVERDALTRRLGCADTTVDRYRTRDGASASLPAGREHLCVPLDGGGTLTSGGTRDVGRHSLSLVPGGTAVELGSVDPTTWLVVGAPVGVATTTAPTVVAVEDLSYDVPTTSSILTARVTDRLGCSGMKVNVRRLRPGDVVPYHTEGTQEELFVPLDGVGAVRVDGESHPLEARSVTRVAPALPRSAVNPGERDLTWLMVGAPPTGAADEWDPGAEYREWPGPD